MDLLRLPNPHILSNVSVRMENEPTSKTIRFRYRCEGRSAGSIPGANSDKKEKTYPEILVTGYRGKATVYVSCVTKDKPYKQHPHNLVGKDCEDGIAKITFNAENKVIFDNLGIQCCKKADLVASLHTRRMKKCDPFISGFDHIDRIRDIDLNAVRLCFHVRLDNENIFLEPIVSSPINGKQSMADLIIHEISDASCTVDGGKKIILLCDKVAKEDIAIRFFENNKDSDWEAFGIFDQKNVHKQLAITFRTPPYRDQKVDHPVSVFLQLYRKSDNEHSEPLPFLYTPNDLSLSASFRRKRPKIEAAANYFKQLEANETMFRNQQKMTCSNQLNIPPDSVKKPINGEVNDYKFPPPQQQLPLPLAQPQNTPNLLNTGHRSNISFPHPHNNNIQQQPHYFQNQVYNMLPVNQENCYASYSNMPAPNVYQDPYTTRHYNNFGATSFSQQQYHATLKSEHPDHYSQIYTQPTNSFKSNNYLMDEDLPQLKSNELSILQPTFVNQSQQSSVAAASFVPQPEINTEVESMRNSLNDLGLL